MAGYEIDVRVAVTGCVVDLDHDSEVVDPSWECPSIALGCIYIGDGTRYRIRMYAA